MTCGTKPSGSHDNGQDVDHLPLDTEALFQTVIDTTEDEDEDDAEDDDGSAADVGGRNGWRSAPFEHLTG